VTLPDKWPEHIVHEELVHEVLGHKALDSDCLTHGELLRLDRFRDLIERARVSGRIRRVVVKDPASQEVIGRGYHRDALRHIVGLRTPRLLVPQPVAESEAREVRGWKPAATSIGKR